jgi:very-short-patch-repair endonuclease/predicted transcriptional regulator of viral defense system
MSFKRGGTAALEAIARRQFGLVTLEQALSVDLSRTAVHRLVRAGALRRVLPRVYALEETDAFEQRALAACLWAGPGSLASHGAAARLLRLDGLDCAEPEVTVPANAHPRRTAVLVHRADLPLEDRRMIRGIPQTSTARTLVDLAAVLDTVPLAVAIEDAWRRKLAQLDWVERRLYELAERGKRGVLQLREVLEDCRSRRRPMDSALEVKFWWLVKQSELPLPESQAEFWDEEGQPCRIDFAYPDQRLAIEVDGFETHGRRDVFEKDRVRLSRLAAGGWRVIHVTSTQLKDPNRVLARIGAALRNPHSPGIP